MFQSYKNQSVDLLSKLVDCFLYKGNNDLEMVEKAEFNSYYGGGYTSHEKRVNFLLLATFFTVYASSKQGCLSIFIVCIENVFVP